MIVVAIYLLDEATDLQSDGGIPVVMITDEGSDETLLRKSAGDYYLHVMAANAEYTVTLVALPTIAALIFILRGQGPTTQAEPSQVLCRSYAGCGSLSRAA